MTGERPASYQSRLMQDKLMKSDSYHPLRYVTITTQAVHNNPRERGTCWIGTSRGSQ